MLGHFAVAGPDFDPAIIKGGSLRGGLHAMGRDANSAGNHFAPAGVAKEVLTEPLSRHEGSLTSVAGRGVGSCEKCMLASSDLIGGRRDYGEGLLDRILSNHHKCGRLGRVREVGGTGHRRRGRKVPGSRSAGEGVRSWAEGTDGVN